MRLTLTKGSFSIFSASNSKGLLLNRTAFVLMNAQIRSLRSLMVEERSWSRTGFSSGSSSPSVMPFFSAVPLTSSDFKMLTAFSTALISPARDIWFASNSSAFLWHMVVVSFKYFVSDPKALVVCFNSPLAAPSFASWAVFRSVFAAFSSSAASILLSSRWINCSYEPFSSISVFSVFSCSPLNLSSSFCSMSITAVGVKSSGFSPSDTKPRSAMSLFRAKSGIRLDSARATKDSWLSAPGLESTSRAFFSASIDS
mmetsp:Transcript_18249/g.40349  ORF Transcript_18249/g.40349 Transcript_18249/m.40349 type:complete len:256 (-) Transcript_18249:472-1239(-)